MRPCSLVYCLHMLGRKLKYTTMENSDYNKEATVC